MTEPSFDGSWLGSVTVKSAARSELSSKILLSTLRRPMLNDSACDAAELQNHRGRMTTVCAPTCKQSTVVRQRQPDELGQTMDVEALSSINSLPVEQKVKTLTGLIASGNEVVVSNLIDRTDGAGIKELAMQSLKMLTDSRLALAALEGK